MTYLTNMHKSLKKCCIDAWQSLTVRETLLGYLAQLAVFPTFNGILSNRVHKPPVPAGVGCTYCARAM
jgi:hypothetical protein